MGRSTPEQGERSPEPAGRQSICPETGEARSAPPADVFKKMTMEARHALALEYAHVASWAWDVASDSVDADAGLNDLFGLPPFSPVTSSAVLAQIHQDDQIRVSEALARTVATGEPYDQRFRVVPRDGRIRWLRGMGEAHVTGDDGQALVVIGVNMDVTDLVTGEERLVAIVGEMRHRIKNSLAMVNALVSATARETDDIATYVEILRGRIDAVASAQQAIGATGDMTLVSLSDAIEGALAPFLSAREWRGRITVDTQETTVSPSLGQAIALSIYELATNAIKYGAFLHDGGSVRLTCRLRQAPERLELTWDEHHSGNQIEVATQGSGFGTKLIERLVRSEKGTIERRVEAGAYRVRLSFVLNHASG